MSKTKYVFTGYCESRDKDGNRVEHNIGDEVLLTKAEAEQLSGVVTKAAKAKEADDETDPNAEKVPQGGGQQ